MSAAYLNGRTPQVRHNRRWSDLEFVIGGATDVECIPYTRHYSAFPLSENKDYAFMRPLLDVAAMRVAFYVYENRGVYALLLGSGSSRTAEIPTGREITVDLIRLVAEMKCEGGQADFDAWYKATAGEQADYSSVVGEPALKMGQSVGIARSRLVPLVRRL